MNGIEILAEKQIEVFGFDAASFWGIVIIGAVIAAFVCFVSSVIDDLEWRTVIVVILGALGGAMFGVVIGIPIAQDAVIGYETVYEVTIDDSVSMTEFLEQYEIIEQRGKIFTIREIRE